MKNEIKVDEKQQKIERTIKIKNEEGIIIKEAEIPWFTDESWRKIDEIEANVNYFNCSYTSE